MLMLYYAGDSATVVCSPQAEVTVQRIPLASTDTPLPPNYRHAQRGLAG